MRGPSKITQNMCMMKNYIWISTFCISNKLLIPFYTNLKISSKIDMLKVVWAWKRLSS